MRRLARQPVVITEKGGDDRGLDPACGDFIPTYMGNTPYHQLEFVDGSAEVPVARCLRITSIIGRLQITSLMLLLQQWAAAEGMTAKWTSAVITDAETGGVVVPVVLSHMAEVLVGVEVVEALWMTSLAAA
jgi:hypothetical protein